MKKSIALFCKDKYFSQGFMSLIRNKYKKDYDVSVFNSKEKMDEYLTNVDDIVFLIADYDYISTISKDNICRIAMSNESNTNKKDNFYTINIYQRDEKLMLDLEKIVVTAMPEEVNYKSGSRCITATFFSAQGGAGTSTIAYMTAVALAKHGKTLYINLGQFPYTDKLYENICQDTMENLVMKASSKENCEHELISISKINSHNVYITPKFNSVGDLYMLSDKCFDYFMENLVNTNYFNYIVIDVQGVLSPKNEIVFSKSSYIFSVYTADTGGKSIKDSFERDPFIKRVKALNNVLFISNKNKVKEIGEDYLVYLPFSQSTENGNDIGLMLERNSDMRDGINTIYNLIIK